MVEPKVTVAIPVGPEKYHAKYLDSAIESVHNQTVEVDEILLVDDMHGLSLGPSAFPSGGITVVDDSSHPLGGCHVWHAPWRMGVAHAFNCGVALARNELVFMLGADDMLLKNCIKECLHAYRNHKQRDGYYWVGVEYSDYRPHQFLPCNAAMVTKGFWRLTGGFPVESAIGAPDAALMSITIGQNMTEYVKIVNKVEPLYWYRVHEESDTYMRAGLQGSIIGVRDWVTSRWKKPTWGRFV